MTTLEAQNLIGKHANYSFNGLTFQVKILDVKTHYGSDAVKITPVSGTGKIWVKLYSVEPIIF